jgi:hypothetical protein
MRPRAYTGTDRIGATTATIRAFLTGEPLPIAPYRSASGYQVPDDHAVGTPSILPQ